MSQPITVVFTPPPRIGMSGLWEFRPMDRSIVEHGREAVVSYRLVIVGDVSSDDNWVFRAVSMGQNMPEQTAFISVYKTTQDVPYPGVGTVGVTFSPEQIDIRVSNQATELAMIGVVLTVGNHQFLYSSRDPQIVLPPSGG